MGKNSKRLSLCISFSFVLFSLFSLELAGSEHSSKSICPDSQEELIKAVHRAAECHDYEGLCSLLYRAGAHKADLVNSFIEGYTPLMRACFRQKIRPESRVLDTISVLLEHGAQVRLVDKKNQNTSLIYALQAGYGPSIIEKLVMCETQSLDGQNNLGLTAVDYATRSPRLLDILRAAGATMPLEVRHRLVLLKREEGSVTENVMH